MYVNKELPESCGWYLDGCIGWFVSCVTNILYQYNIQTNVLSIVSFIPTSNSGPYQNPSCIKSGDLIYCFPEYESRIWCYDLNSRQWREINIYKKMTIPAMAFMLGEYKGVGYFFSCGYEKLFGIDLKSGAIKSYRMDVKITCAYYIHGVLTDGKVYLVFGGTSIYEFDLEKCCQKTYDFPYVDDILFRIEVEEDNFWIIGKKERVYIWKKGENKISTLTVFPSEISFYDFEKKKQIMEYDDNAEGLFVFNSIHQLREKIWLMPLSASHILYFDKKDMKIRIFDILNEEETEESMDLYHRRIASKFALMYIRQERYLGIYSYRNKWIFEIDSLKMTYQKVNFMIDEYSLLQVPIQEFYEGQDNLMYMIYSAKMNNSNYISDRANRKIVGGNIYKKM